MKLKSRKFFPLYIFLIFFALITIFLWYLNNFHSNQTDISEFIIISKRTKSNNYLKELNPLNMRENKGKMVEYTLSGHRVIYTIDPILQIWMNNELKKYELPYGAAFLASLPDGEVKVMSGYSAVSPKLSFLELNLTAWAPAASLFKVVTLTSLLLNGISPDITECYHSGRHGLTPNLLKDNKNEDIHCIPLSTAIAESANVVTAKLAMKNLTIKQLLNSAYMYGFDQTLPFEFPIKKSIIQIDEQNKYALPFTAAGFGTVTLSPFHAAWIMGIIANKGKTPPFHIIRSVKLGEKVLKTPKYQVMQTKITPQMSEVISGILEKTVTEGTAKSAFFNKQNIPYLGFSVAGKTGTLSRNKPFYLQYTWFAGFAPVKNPKVVFAVLVVNPLKWKTKATYVAERLLLKYFSLLKSKKSTKPVKNP